METNKNKTQNQGSSNQFSQGKTNSSQSGSSNSNQGSASSIGGMNMENLSQQFQKYSTPIMNKVNSLSTTQKVVGGALLAAGAGWLAMNPKSRSTMLNNFKKAAANKK